MGQWSYERVKLPLKYDWSIARGKSTERTNIVVQYSSDSLIGRGEIAFITGGDFLLEDAECELEEFFNEVPGALNGLEDMMEHVHDQKRHPSVTAGLETAYLNYLAQVMQGPIEKVLALDTSNKYPTCYSIPLLETGEYKSFIEEHNLNRFKSLKIKIAGRENAEAVNEIAKIYKGMLWLDGNESFQSYDELESFCKIVPMERVEVFEQPFLRTNFNDQKRAKNLITRTLWFADESLQNGSIHFEFAELFHGVNIKLMKSGGLFSALRQIREAKSLRLKIMLGCMLETTLGLHAMSSLAYEADYIDFDSFLFLKKDPYLLLDEESGLIIKGFQQ